jgi:DNA-binding PadR family transcriptional regulator
LPTSGFRKFLDGEKHGATATELDSVLYHLNDRSLASLSRVLAEMEDAGLIERQELPGSKPYFITDKGREYLEQAKQKAIFLDTADRRGWADEVADDARQSLAGFIRQLPEFEGSGEARIQEVAGQLRLLTENRSKPASQSDRHPRLLGYRPDCCKNIL